MAEQMFSQPSPAAGIADGMIRALQEKRRKAYDSELEKREALAKQFESIYQDPQNWDHQSRAMAHQYAMQLRMLEPTAKRPKELLPDKEGKIPAMVNVTYRKAVKDGPQEPPEPPMPQEPGAPMDPSGGMPAEPSMPVGAPQPGGEQIGPNQITTAPAIPGMPGAPGMQAPGGAGPLGMLETMTMGGGGGAPAPGSMPMEPSMPMQAAAPPMPVEAAPSAPAAPVAPAAEPELEYAMRDPRDAAIEQAELNQLANSIEIKPEIAETLGIPPGRYPASLLIRLQAAEDRRSKLLAKGLDENGQPLQWKTEMDQAAIGLKNAQAEAARATAAGKPDEAAAILTRAAAAMLSARASWERAINPAPTTVPVYNEDGEITGFYGAPRQEGFVDSETAGLPEGSFAKPPKIQEGEEFDEYATGYFETRQNRILTSVAEIFPDVSAATVGPLAKAQMNMPGTPARHMKARLDTLLGQIAFGELQAMREASKTGGALGQVAIREIELLQAALGSLDQGMTPEQFRGQLRKIHAQAQQSMAEIERKKQELRKKKTSNSGGTSSSSDPSAATHRYVPGQGLVPINGD